MENTETTEKKTKKPKLEAGKFYYGKFKELYVTLEQIGNIPDLPIGKILSINLNRMKKILTEKEEVIESVIEKFARTDDKGNRLGVEYEHTGEDGKKETKRRDLKGYFSYEWVDVEDREAFKAEIQEKLDEVIEYKILTVPHNKKVSVITSKEYGDKDKKVERVEKEVELLDALETKLSPNAISFLLNNVIEYKE